MRAGAILLLFVAWQLWWTNVDADTRWALGTIRTRQCRGGRKLRRGRARQTHGAVLDNIDALVPGDRIYVQTREGYYVYVFRNSQIVLASQAARGDG
jgi:hypothetical protein